MTTPAPVASNPVLRMTLVVGAIVNTIIGAVIAIIGFMMEGSNGAISGVVGVVFGFIFLAITALSILIANRWNGTELYATLFYAIVLGGWLLKFVVFLVGFFLIKDQPWMHNQIFYVALVVTVLASLIVDVVVMQKMRIPIEIDLPTSVDDGEGSDRSSNPHSDRENTDNETPASDSLK